MIYPLSYEGRYELEQCFFAGQWFGPPCYGGTFSWNRRVFIALLAYHVLPAKSTGKVKTEHVTGRDFLSMAACFFCRMGVQSNYPIFVYFEARFRPVQYSRG